MNLWKYLRELLEAVKAISVNTRRTALATEKTAAAIERLAEALEDLPATNLELQPSGPPQEQSET